MIRPFSICASALLLALWGSAILRAQSVPTASPTSPLPATPEPSPAPFAHKQVAPLPPAELLTLLPKTPDQWQLKHSEASNVFMVWASSHAMRDFSYTPPHNDAAGPTAPPPQPLGLQVTVIDTGYYQRLIGDFEKAPPARPGAVQYLTLAGYPARQSPLGKTGERLRVLVNGRYVVQIDTQNQPANSTQSWLRLFDLPKIAALPVEGDETLTRPYTIIRLDEMNPQNNSTSQVTWGTKEELERASNRR